MKEQSLKKISVPPHNNRLQLSEAQYHHLFHLMELNCGLGCAPLLLLLGTQQAAVVAVGCLAARGTIPVKQVAQEVR